MQVETTTARHYPIAGAVSGAAGRKCTHPQHIVRPPVGDVQPSEAVLAVRVKILSASEATSFRESRLRPPD
jgi:hypothetical protein